MLTSSNAQSKEEKPETEGIFELSIPTRVKKTLIYGYKHRYLERNKQHVHLVK